MVYIGDGGLRGKKKKGGYMGKKFQKKSTNNVRV